MSVLSVRDLKKSYARGLFARKTQVLKGLSFSVPAGSITGFLGANGAGKTTTMRCILGLDHADSGVVEYFGEPLSTSAREKIGFLPERPFFYEHLTGREFLEFYARLTSSWKKSVLNEKIDSLLKRVDLTFAKDRPLRHYSKGMLQKIGVAQALIHDPELVILDEPMSGLDPDGRMALAEIIVETAKQGTAVFFSSHLLHDNEKLCHRLVVLKDGTSIFEGPMDELLDRSEMEFEVTYLKNEKKETLRVGSQEQMQNVLRDLTSKGAVILEARRLRASLEEVFVKMAMKGRPT